jgi:hypothetical protein
MIPVAVIEIKISAGSFIALKRCRQAEDLKFRQKVQGQMR